MVARVGRDDPVDELVDRRGDTGTDLAGQQQATGVGGRGLQAEPVPLRPAGHQAGVEQVAQGLDVLRLTVSVGEFGPAQGLVDQ